MPGFETQESNDVAEHEALGTDVFLPDLIKNAMNGGGMEVFVLRSGQTEPESGWKVVKMLEDGRIQVTKEEDGVRKEKDISPDKLKEWNAPKW